MASETRTWGEGTPSVEALVDAALRLIDEHGLAALSTRRLATEMGIFQPTIYRRVVDRDALLALVADAIMAEAGLPHVDPSDWRAWLLDWAVRVRGAWARHPNAVPLLHYGAGQAASVRVLEQALAVFLGGGFHDNDVPGALQAYLGFVFGVALLEGMGRSRADTTGGTVSAVDPVEFPNLVRVQEHLRSETSAAPKDERFLAGLEIVLDGLGLRRDTGE
jgi:AcrR family transcriptional regulator